MFRRSNNVQWRAHLGAHKTATTHLQDTLALNVAKLEAAGISYLSRQDIRSSPILRPSRRFGPRRKTLDGTFPLRHARAVLSDELFLGLAPAFLSPVPYPDAKRRLAPLHPLSGIAYLSIRCFADALPSCYAQALRAHPLGSFEDLCGHVATVPPHWFDLAHRVRAILKTPVAVWTFDSYVDDPRSVISAFIGADASEFRLASHAKNVASPSEKAVREVQGRLGDLVGPDRPARVQDIYDRYPAREFGRYDPFDSRVRADLTATYGADLDRLRAEFDVIEKETAPKPG